MMTEPLRLPKVTSDKLVELPYLQVSLPLAGPDVEESA